MNRLLCATLLVCLGLSASAAQGQNLADAIRNYFPGKWKVEDGDLRQCCYSSMFPRRLSRKAVAFLPCWA